MDPQRDELITVSVQISRGLYDVLQAELRLCGCQSGSFVRNAIAAEIARRARARREAVPEPAIAASHVASHGE